MPTKVGRGSHNVDVRPAGNGTEVVRYLARYVKRTAISDERIIAADDKSVRFGYTDSVTRERRELELDAAEFMRRYLRHVPEPGQHRVRYFGWLHPAAKQRRMRVENLLAKTDHRAGGSSAAPRLVPVLSALRQLCTDVHRRLGASASAMRRQLYQNAPFYKTDDSRRAELWPHD